MAFGEATQRVPIDLNGDRLEADLRDMLEADCSFDDAPEKEE